MKIEAEKWYLLADGSKVRVIDVDTLDGLIFPIIGENEKNKIISWTLEGKFRLGKDHQKDFVKELPKEEYPELYL